MDALRARTLWQMLDGRDPAITAMILAVAKLCALAVELVWKCSLTNEQRICGAPEEKHGIVERALMFRMFPIFLTGYREPLQAKHLFKIGYKLLTGRLETAGEGMFDLY